jgi:hypothetical protein
MQKKMTFIYFYAVLTDYYLLVSDKSKKEMNGCLKVITLMSY